MALVKAKSIFKIGVSINMSSRIFSLVIFVIFLSSTNANAFQFEYLTVKDPVHQEMSSRAFSCANSRVNSQAYCEDFIDDELHTMEISNVEGINSITRKEIEEAVIWADDPLRELDWKHPYRIVLWASRIQLDECKGKVGGLKNGLRCSSHYGPLQFLHSMLSGNTVNLESNDKRIKETKDIILNWIDYSYSVAINRLDVKTGKYFNDIEVCKFNFKEIRPEYVSRFTDELFPSNKFPCNSELPLIDPGDVWHLNTIYSFDCNDFFSSLDCDGEREKHTPLDLKKYRLAALGAILHVIQDSYSKGHTDRGNNSEIHRYECTAIKEFSDYSQEDHKMHSKMDERSFASPSCKDNQKSIHGPITASAEVLRLFKKGSDVKEVLSYVSKYVYALEYESK